MIIMRLDQKFKSIDFEKLECFFEARIGNKIKLRSLPRGLFFPRQESTQQIRF